MDNTSNKTDAPKELDATEIHNASLEDIFEEQADLEDAAKNAPPVEAKPEEKPPVVETPPVEAKPVEAAPVLDTDKLKEDISQATAEKIVTALAPDASKEEKKDFAAKIKDMQETAAKEGREITYLDALKVVQEETKESLRVELKDEVKQEVLKDLAAEVEKEDLDAKTKQEQADKETQTRNEAWTKEWDGQLDDLTALGKLPAVNPNETRTDENGIPLDPGRRARFELFKTMQDVMVERQKEGKTPVFNMKEIYYEHFLPKNDALLKAKAAPVAGSRTSVGATDNTEFTNREIHNMSLEDILASGN